MLKIIATIAVLLLCSDLTALPSPEKLSIEDFTSDPNLFSLDISPDGRYLAEVWRRDNIRYVSVRDLQQTGYPVIGQFGDQVMRPFAVKWANNERLLVKMLVPYRHKKIKKKSQTDNDFDIREFPMSYRTISVRPDTKDAVVLLNDSRQLSRLNNLSSIQHIIPNDPEHILMSAWAGNVFTLFKVNIYNGKSQEVTHGSPYTFLFSSDKDGNPLYRADVARFSKKVYLYQYEDGTWSKIITLNIASYDDEEEDDKFTGEFAGIDSEKNLLYRKINEETGFYEIRKYDIKTRVSTIFVSEKDKDIISLITSSKDSTIIGYTTDGDTINRHYFDTENQAKHDKIKSRIPGNSYRFIAIDDNKKTSVIRTDSPDSLGSYFLYHPAQDTLQFYDTVSKKLTPQNLGISANAYYKTRDNITIRMYILFPPAYDSSKKYPLIVMPHGGPQSRDYAYYDEFSQFLATRGYIVVKPNFRGSTGYGLGFEKQGYKQWGGVMQQDLDDAALFMIKKGYTNKDNICIVGGDYGGYAALIGATQNPDLYRCAVSLNGISDLTKQLKYEKKRFSEHPKLLSKIYEIIGDPKKDAEMLKKNSPINNIANIKSPVLIIAGKYDRVVPYKQSKTMAKKMKKANKDVKFVTLKNAGHHILYYVDHREKVYKEVEKFLSDNLKNPHKT